MIICDKCKAELPISFHDLKYLEILIVAVGRIEVHLCDPCAEKFYELIQTWLKEPAK